MTSTWYSGISTRGRLFDTPSKLLTRVLAAIGILVFIDRSASYYTLNARDRYNTGAGSGIRPFKSHPLDTILLHESINTGYGSYGQKAVVVASMASEDTSWIQKHLSDWQDNIYVVDDAHANLTVFNGNGREAAVYLTYIISHYYSLPDYVAFLHAERYQWHNDDPMYDGVMPMKNLQLDHVKEAGYVSLRCVSHPGCPAELHPDPKDDDGYFGFSAAYAHAFEHIFPDRDLPQDVAAPCCAQFVVSKEAITKTSLNTWERARQWLWDNDIGNQKSGRVMEYMWHILMGEAAVSCPNVEECYCKTYGLCDLECSELGYCEGRYMLPHWNETMPEGWPFEGQGEHGWPEYGWWHEWYPNEDFGLAYIGNGSGADIIESPNTDTEVPDIDVDPAELVATVMGEPMSKAPNMEPELTPIDEAVGLFSSDGDDDDESYDDEENGT